jgi:hypothetical protein
MFQKIQKFLKICFVLRIPVTLDLTKPYFCHKNIVVHIDGSKNKDDTIILHSALIRYYLTLRGHPLPFPSQKKFVFRFFDFHFYRCIEVCSIRVVKIRTTSSRIVSETAKFPVPIFLQVRI